MADRSWQRISEIDPYWGVVSSNEFHTHTMTDEARQEFFAKGTQHLAGVLKIIRALRPGFRPRQALDFGCGVGRVTMPMARECDHVLAVDISAGMLREARRNAEAAGVSANISFAHQIAGSFDFVHSEHVFQHIDEPIGLLRVGEMANALVAGGAGVLHFHYWRGASAIRHLVHWLRPRVPLVNSAINVLQGRAWNFPLIRMEAYSLNKVLRVLNDAGVSAVYAIPEDRGVVQNVKLYIFKN
jgi:SAM-dependent methyltransferase